MKILATGNSFHLSSTSAVITSVQERELTCTKSKAFKLNNCHGEYAARRMVTTHT